MAGRAVRVGDVLDGRWVVLGQRPSSLGSFTVLRDNQWNGARFAALPCPDDVQDDAFLASARRWLDASTHPGLVQAFYSLPVEGRLHVFFELVTGPTLAEALGAPGNRLPVTQALSIGLQLASIVAHLHQRHLVHGDLHPDHVVLPKTAVVKLSGLSLGSPPARGSERMLAPEQWAAPQRAPTSHSDVYQLGALLYWLFTGWPPFSADAPSRARWASWGRSQLTPVQKAMAYWSGTVPLSGLEADQAELLTRPTLNESEAVQLMEAMHRLVDPMPAVALAPDVDPELARLIGECLAKDPEQRPDITRLRRKLFAATSRSGAPPDVALDAEPTETTENQRAAAFAAMGELSSAKNILDRWLRQHPASLVPWMNRRRLAVLEDPSLRAGIGDEVDRDLRPHHADLDGRPEFILFMAEMRQDTVVVERPVQDLHWWPDDSELVVGSTGGGLLQLWNPAHPDVRLFGPAERPVERSVIVAEGVAVSAGHRVSLLNRKGQLVWDREVGGLIRSLGTSPGELRVVVTTDEDVFILQSSTGRMAREVLGSGQEPILGAAVSREERFVAIARASGITVQNPLSGHIHLQLPLPEGHLVGLRYGVDDGLWVIGREAFEYGVDGRLLRTLSHESGPIHALSLARDGAMVATGGDAGVVLWGAGDRPLATFAHLAAVGALALAGGRLATSDQSGRLFVWPVRDHALGAQEIARVRLDVPLLLDGSTTLQRNVQERTALIQRLGTDEGLVVGPMRARPDFSMLLEGAVGAVAFDADGSWLAVAHGDEVSLSKVTALAVEKKVGSRSGAPGPIRVVAVSRDGAVAAGSAPGAPAVYHEGAKSVVAPAFGHHPILWWPPQGEAVAGAGHHVGPVFALREGLGGRQWLSAGAEPAVFSYVTDPGAQTIARDREFALSSGSGPLRSIALSPDGRWLAAGGAQGRLVLWDRHSGEVVREKRVGEHDLTLVEFSHDGRRLAIATDHNELMLLHLREDRLLYCQGHEGPVVSAGFTRDDRFLVSASADGQGRLWEVSVGRARLVMPLGGPITAAAFSPARNLLVVGRSDGGVQAWLLLWAYADLSEALPVAEQVFGSAPEASVFWPGPHERRQASDWIDLWRDLGRLTSTPSGPDPQLHERVARVRSRILYELVHTGTDFRPRPKDPLLGRADYEVASIDPSLAFRLEAL